MGPYGGSDAHPSLIRLGEAQLKDTKEASAARNAYGGKAKLAEETLPGFATDPMPTFEVLEQGQQACLAMWGQLNGLADSIDQPAEENLGGGPGAILH